MQQRFKVGDMVEVIKCSSDYRHFFPIGTLCKVTHVYGRECALDNIDQNADVMSQYLQYSDIRPYPFVNKGNVPVLLIEKQTAYENS